jgi:hypothetical protein
MHAYAVGLRAVTRTAHSCWSEIAYWGSHMFRDRVVEFAALALFAVVVAIVTYANM